MPPRSPHFRMPAQMPWSPQPNIAPQGNGPHAVRMQFQILPGVLGTNMAGVRVPVSNPMRVDGLIMKTVQLVMPAIGALPVIIQGSITDIGDSLGWFDLFPAIGVPGIFPIAIADANVLTTHEPSLNAIRLLSTGNAQQQPPLPASFPSSLLATFSGFWIGPGLWLSRHTPYEQ